MEDPDENPDPKISPEFAPFTVLLREIVRNSGGQVRPVASELGCTFPGRFDFEDTSRDLGWGRAPGEGRCDYPNNCPFKGDDRYHCPVK